MSGVDSCLYRCVTQGHSDDFCETRCFNEAWNSRQPILALVALAAIALLGKTYFNHQKVQLKNQGAVLSAKKFEAYENYADKTILGCLAFATLSFLGNILIFFLEKDINQALRNR
jgi:hypothetical protein